MNDRQTPSAHATRDAATRHFASIGYPSRRDEYWKFTDPAPLIDPNGAHGGAADDSPSDLLADIPCHHVSFVGDTLQPGAASQGTLELTALATALADANHWSIDDFGRLESRARQPVARPFATLNTSEARSGLAIRATGAVDRPLAITYGRETTSMHAMLRHVVRIEAGGQLTLVESGLGAAHINKVIEVEVADGAQFHHVQVQGRSETQHCATHIFARLGSGATFKSFTLTADGALTRNETIVELAGEGGRAHLSGAAFGMSAFHHDDTVFVRHAAQDCESRQVFKKVMPPEAIGVFQGKILVDAGAQKTDGYQMSQGLLLADSSQFLAKPELEIYADDVICSHGSTCGSLDEESLFYLRSRGVPLAEARDLLALSFLMEPILEIEDQRLVDALAGLLETWLARQRQCQS